MNTKNSFGGRLRPKEEKVISWENLVDLPNERMAIIYQRLSSHEQVKKSIYSIKAQDALKDLAMEDGYPESQIHTEDRDLGISGTKGREERPGLAYLIQQVEAGLVESVYVIHMSRLHRDQTLINALSLGELFKEHGVIIVTPQMRLNLRDRMHMRMYRMEIERAADELELMANRLLGAKDLKAKSGLYAGENVPPGYVVNEQQRLDGGTPNPDYHSFQIYEPHAEIVRTIFEQMAKPGMTPIRVMRYFQQNGILFPPFPPDLDTPANRKVFAQCRLNSDGSWPITRGRIRSIASSPCYIGWKFWAGEMVSKEAYPAIIDEETFRAVQRKLNTRKIRPKQEYDPLPLARLLYCGKHQVPRPMRHSNAKNPRDAVYRCGIESLGEYCFNISAHFLDEPIGEAVISQLSFGDLADELLHELSQAYEQAQEQAASYGREMRRLESEIDSLRTNLAAGVMSTEQLQWLDTQIQQRLAHIKELTDLQSQPIGAAVGPPLPDKDDIELVKTLLTDLGKTWHDKPNGLKNILLRLLLDRVTVWPDSETIRARLSWVHGWEQEISIRRPGNGPLRRWTDTELELLRTHYATATKEELLAMLPERSWKAIRNAASRRLGLSRGNGGGSTGQHFTREEDQLVHRYYAGEITRNEVLAIGRSSDGISQRAKLLGLKWTPRQPNWEPIQNDRRDVSSGSAP